jgi:hypothetical protein
MPNAGEESTAYCKKCERKTTWRYVNWVLKTFWLCLVCETRRERFAVVMMMPAVRIYGLL